MKMNTCNYWHDVPHPLTHKHQYQLLNNYRIYKYMIEVMMSKNLRGYHSKELNDVVSDDFTMVNHIPMFAADAYNCNDGSPVTVTDLPQLDGIIDRQEMKCAYSMWTLLNKQKIAEAEAV